jgi:DNA-binding CsgD family transcriptional regulator
VNRCAPGDIALRGIGTMTAVLLAVAIQFWLRRGVWNMLNIFLVFSTAGILLLALDLPDPWQTVGCLIFGIGDGIGYILIFYFVGFIKRYRNDRVFWLITLATIVAIAFSVIAEWSVVLIMPGAMPTVAVVFAVFFLFVFQFLSPVIQRNVFAADWIDDLNKPDVIIAMEKVEQADSFEDLGLSPREREVAALLLQGYTFRQISASLGIAESTVNGYSGTLYKKLSVNSRSELFKRFRVPDSNGKQPKTK